MTKTKIGPCPFIDIASTTEITGQLQEKQHAHMSVMLQALEAAFINALELALFQWVFDKLDGVYSLHCSCVLVHSKYFR